MKKLDFIRKVESIHGSECYDLSGNPDKFNAYSGKVIVRCIKHNVTFETVGLCLLKESFKGCEQCRLELRKQNFIDKSNVVHKGKYDYSLVNYVGNQTEVEIICPIHGVFKQTPAVHSSGCGCPYCSGNAKSTTEEFIEKAKKVHTDKNYDYRQVHYINSTTKVKIICPEHGMFEQTPNSHLRGKGCPLCARWTLDEFVEKSSSIHHNMYDYSKVEFVDLDTKVLISCSIHGYFLQSPNKHLNGEGCPKCYTSKTSHLVDDVMNSLVEHNINFEIEKKFLWLKYKNLLRLDFYLPEFRVAIECHGSQHFIKNKFLHRKQEDYENQCIRDDLKNKLCKEHNIEIFYYAKKEYETNYRLGKVYVDIEELLYDITMFNKQRFLTK